MDSNSQLLDAARWIGLVFVGGFIGYFGRHFALSLIEGFKKKPEKRNSAARIKGSNEAENNSGKSSVKVDKKQSKLEIKRTKKN